MRRGVLAAVMASGLCFCFAAFADVASEINDVASGTFPRLASDEKGNLHVAFERSEPGAKPEIYYTQSSDGGKHWTPPTDISMTPGKSSHPDIAVERNGAIDVVWLDTKSGETRPAIFSSRSRDGGKTWTEPMDVSNTPGIASEPALATGPDDSVHVIWIDTTSGVKRPDVFYSCSTDGAKTWTKALMISDTPGVSSRPTIATDSDGTVHVAWKDTTSGETHPDIYYVQKKSRDAWTKPAFDVSNSARISDFPSIACGQGKIFLAWSDNSRKEKSPDIWCSLSGKNAKFSQPLNISNTPGVSSEPSVTPDREGCMAVVWADTSSRINNADIYARLSVDGLNDVSGVMDISHAKGDCKHPDVALVGDRMFVIWQEDDGERSLLKMTAKAIRNIGAGPSRKVDESIRAVPSNSR
jgi:hypothetical protein